MRTSSRTQKKKWRQGEKLKIPSHMLQIWKGKQQLLQKRHETLPSSFSLFPLRIKSTRIGKSATNPISLKAQVKTH